MSDSLAYYCDLWGLSDPEPLATTVTSHVYTVLYQGERVVLKCLTPRGFEEREGAKALQCFDGQGAVRLLQHDDDAHLMEYASGKDLVGMVRDGDDDSATRIIAEVLNQLHAAPPHPVSAEITTLDTWFQPLFKKAADDKANGADSIYMRGANIAEQLLAHPRDVCVLHGDIHHQNVRFREGRGWLAFDPKGLVGERTFDTANVLRNPEPLSHLVYNEPRVLKTTEILARTMRLDVPRILAFTFAFACLSAAWIFNDGDDPVEDLTIASLVAPHLPASL